MSEEKKDGGISSGWYLLSGVVIGAVAGVLLAPKKGSETLEDLNEWGRDSREKTRSLMSRIGRSIPTRVKAAAAIGAVKEGAGEAFHETREKAKDFLGS